MGKNRKLTKNIIYLRCANGTLNYHSNKSIKSYNKTITRKMNIQQLFKKINLLIKYDYTTHS